MVRPPAIAKRVPGRGQELGLNVDELVRSKQCGSTCRARGRRVDSEGNAEQRTAQGKEPEAVDMPYRISLRRGPGSICDRTRVEQRYFQWWRFFIVGAASVSREYVSPGSQRP